MIDKEQILELANERIADHDPTLFIVDLQINKDSLILVELDKMGGSVSIQDCIAVSRNIEHNLDREEEDFSLEVTSAGLDKPLRVLKQFEKNIGRNVQVFLKEHGKSIEGELKDFSEEGITVETQEKVRLEGKKKKVLEIKQLELKFEDIKETKLIISF
ncbi:ribosome assembly cofactor RimP [Crocinitomix catalasitica]|uniref:ribosome assembly cofactor RimP n=1 Tax=Crocinitomix catalasitica TaxID=184607 RepID=UPI000483C147|nr:ribosome assembly cofactor RimP [Crocinitomix catalasitica]